MEMHKELTPADLPEGCRPLAELLGLDTFLRVADAFGGEMIYIPNMNRIYLDRRNQDIRTQYHGAGEKIETLSQKYSLSKRQIRNIVHSK